MSDTSQLSRKILETVANQCGGAYAGLNRQKEVVLWSPEAAKWFGCSPEAALGKPLAEVLPEADSPAWQEFFRRLKAHEPFSNHPVPLSGSEGGSRSMICSGRPVLEQDGAPAGWTLLFRPGTSTPDFQDALRIDPVHLLTILDHTLDAIITIDAGGTIVSANRAVETIFGYTVREVLGENVRMLMPEPDRSRHDEYIRRYLETGERKIIGIGREVQGLRKDGTRFPLDLAINRVHLNGVRFFVGILRDITDRKRLEEGLLDLQEKKLQQIQSLIDSVENSIALLDERGVIVLVNEAWKRFARENEASDPVMQGIGIDYLNILKEFNQEGEAMRQSLEAVLQGKQERFSFEYPCHSPNQPRWFRMTCNALKGQSGCVVTHVDISRLKLRELETRQMKEQADKANQAKSEFLSQMSHELRTPLNAILGFAQLLQQNPREPLSEYQKKDVEEILKAGKHLLTLINEILDLARIESGKLSLSPQPFSLEEVVTETRTLMLPVARKKNVRISCATDAVFKPVLHADRIRFKQVLLNLVSNAVKYNRQDGIVQISWEPAEQEGYLLLRVQDTGIGIRPEERERIFEPFDRLGAESSGIEGTGIGLAFTKKLVEMMGGTIGLESEPGKGSLFYIRFPMADEPADASPSPAPETLPENTPGGREYTVLYIEDNPANVRLVERGFSLFDHLNLLTAPDGRVGIDLALSYQPDLIILDFHLPHMDGKAVLKFLREQEETRPIPVIALSAQAGQKDTGRILAMGAQHYLSKPIDIRQLMQVVQGELAGRAWQGQNKGTGNAE